MMASTVASLSPRHIKRFPVSTIDSEERFFEALDEDVRRLIEVSCDCFKGD